MIAETKKPKKKSQLQVTIPRRMGALEKFRRMATVIQDSNDAITFQDLEGNILEWNRGAELMYGYSEAEALTMNIVDTVPQEYQEEARQFLSALKRGELVPNLETKRKTKDGRIIDVWLTNTKITDERGHLTGIATTERDITQLKRAESSQYARSLIEASLDPLVTINSEGKITDVNEGSIKVTGISREKLIGTDFSDYFTEPEKAREGYQQVFAKGFVTDYPLTIRRVDGNLTDVLYNASVYKDAQGNVLGAFAAARDITQQRQASQYARSLIEASLDPLVTISSEGKITDVNEGSIKVTGLPREKLIGTDFSDYFTEPEKAREGYQQVFAKGFVTDYPLTIRRIDGKLTDVLYNASVYKDVHGSVLGVFAAARDVTQQKHLEFLSQGRIALSDKMRGEQDVARLGRSVLSHVAPFLNAQMGAFYCLTEEKTLKRVSGYASSKIDETEKTIALGEGLVGQVAMEKKPILINQVPPDYFGKIGSDLGSSSPRSLLLAPVFYEGEVNGVIELASFGVFSEHHKAFLAHVSENIGIAINTSISRRKQERLLERSQILAEKLQSQQAELTATNDELENQAREIQVSQMELKSQQHQLERTNEQLENQTETLEVQRDVLNENIVALNKAQALLEERSEEIQRASQYKSAFLANMSHELRSPLNSSMIFAKILADNAGGNLNQEQVHYAQLISSAGNDLLSLINDILDLSKVEAGKLEIRPESVHLPEVFNGLEKMFGPLASEKHLKFQIEVDPGMPESMVTDRQRLEQILKNLLSNAFKFTEKGQVTLQARKKDGRISLAVTDTGIGVAKENQEVIFEAFRQVDGTTNRKYAGTGLGLSISRDLARLLGGTVEVKSKPELGSRFTLLLPELYDDLLIADATPKVYSSPSPPATTVDPPAQVMLSPFSPISGYGGKQVGPDQTVMEQLPKDMLSRSDVFAGKKVLVVDDDVRNIFSLTAALEQRGAVIEVARNGKEALAKLKVDPHMDLVLMDIMMPEMDGYQATREIRKQECFAKLPIIALTAQDTKRDQVLCSEAGATGYLAKPIDLNQLFSLIGTWAPQSRVE